MVCVEGCKSLQGVELVRGGTCEGMLRRNVEEVQLRTDKDDNIETGCKYFFCDTPTPDLDLAGENTLIYHVPIFFPQGFGLAKFLGYFSEYVYGNCDCLIDENCFNRHHRPP